MEKLDLTKAFKSYYSAKAIPEIITLEPANFLSIEGKGDPSGPGFMENTQALFTLAYGLKFHMKQQKKDFVVSKLEAQWWFDFKQYGHITLSTAPQIIPREEWEYRLLIRMPDFINEKDLNQLVPILWEKKKLEGIKKVELVSLQEGEVVQILHCGPYSTEPESLKKMQEFMESRQLIQNGHHHEIYLSDFRKTAPEKLKTILREPVKRIS